MKFSKADQKYFDARKQFSEDSGPREIWSLIDHWALYCGISNLARFVAITDLFRSTLDVPGDIAEFGSWRGANLILLAKLLRIFDPLCRKQVHCFDSFEGLTQFSAEDGLATGQVGAYSGVIDELNAIIDLYEMEDEVQIHQGLIEDTLPQFLDKRKEVTFSFIYCDTDLFSSTQQILKSMHPRLSPGGLFVFDEWNDETYPGEGLAVNDFLAENYGVYEVQHIRHTRQPTLAIRKAPL